MQHPSQAELIRVGDGLPPQESLAFDRRSADAPGSLYQALSTPTDNRGLVQVDEMVDTVLQYVDTDYDWPGFTSVHHLYARESVDDYPRMPELGTFDPFRFWNLAVHKVRVPRQFENLVHWLMRPPESPVPEVRSNRVLAWRVAHDLFKQAEYSELWLHRDKRRMEQIAREGDTVLRAEYNGEDIIGRAIMDEILEKRFSLLHKFIEQNDRLPDGYHVIEPGTVLTEEIIARMKPIVKGRAVNLLPRMQRAS